MYAEPSIVIRRPVESDVQPLSELVYRFHAFNEEFDPSWAAIPNLRLEVAKYASQMLRDERSIVLVAAKDSALLGYVRAVLEENPLVTASRVLVIKELYVRPQERRQGIATQLVNRVMDEARKLRALHVAVECPAANRIAEDLYSKMGFRPHLLRYIKEV
ncbi:MAG: GNAT family N-acetyltransferase [Acidilobus sp.]